MENLTLIQSERIDFIQNELQEIKSLLQGNQNQAELNKWLPKPEARNRLHVCLKTLDNYLSKGILPYSRFAGKIYVKASDIQAHLEKHYIKS
jgi:hypothetical protein